MMATSEKLLEQIASSATLSSLIAITLLLGIGSILRALFHTKSNLPWINYDKSQWTYTQAKLHFRFGARKLITQGFQKFSGPFKIVTELGPLVMLSPDYIDAVNREANLDFRGFIREQFLSQYSTFKVFNPALAGPIEEAIGKGLTRSLPKFTKTLSDEMTRCLDDAWTQSTDWHEVELRQDVLSWVARLASRTFNDDRLTNNPEWLRLCKEHTVNLFAAAGVVRMYPSILRWFAERTLPMCRKLRAEYKAAGKILSPILAERKAEIEAAKREGRKPNLPNDSIEWFRTAFNGQPYDDINVQMNLALSAIHTTSDLLGQSILNLCAYPEMVEPIRKEAIEVLSKHGWKKASLNELHILDSFLKETQRCKPITFAFMHRVATANVELPNGIRINRGERMAISSHRMWSEKDYEDPEKFDGYRFLKRRQLPGYEYKSSLTTTTPDHTGFSHGKHACPGRYFAASEVKVAIVHLVLKYDFEVKDLKVTKWIEMGNNMFVNPKAKINVRRRKEEIDLESLEGEV